MDNSSNDGATILKYMNVEHPAAILFVEVSRSQDDRVGDGTTSVVLLGAELLKRSTSLLSLGFHPSTICYVTSTFLSLIIGVSESMQNCHQKYR
jgi:chaperonin GroEL (HSP60 family)